MTKATGKRSEELTRDFVAFGVGDDGKPRAARFIVSNTGLLAKAAEAMKLKITEVTTDPVKEVAKKLPSGRLYSNGKGFVPNVRRDLYIKLAAALWALMRAYRSHPVKGPRWLLRACREPGTRSNRATWSSRRRRLSTAGGRPS